MLQLLKLETFIKSLDLSTIISNTVGKDISNAFVKLFLVDKDKNGAIKSISPFFILLMAMSIFGIVGATTQAIREENQEDMYLRSWDSGYWQHLYLPWLQTTQHNHN